MPCPASLSEMPPGSRLRIFPRLICAEASRVIDTTAISKKMTKNFFIGEPQTAITSSGQVLGNATLRTSPHLFDVATASLWRTREKRMTKPNGKNDKASHQKKAGTNGSELVEYKPGTAFPGVLGRTIAESTAAWPQPLRARPGTPNVLFIVLDDTGFGQLG